LGGFFDVRTPGLLSELQRIPNIALSLESYLVRELHWVILNAINFLRALSLWVVYAYALKLQGLSIRREIKGLTMVGLIGFGLTFSNTLAVCRGLFVKKPAAFLRTPKYRIERKEDTWEDKKYGIELDRVIIGELSLAALGLGALITAIFHGNFGVVPILVLYLAAYSYMISKVLQEKSHF